MNDMIPPGIAVALPEPGRLDGGSDVQAPQPRVSFWQHRWAQNVIPLLTSLAIHASLIGLGFLTYQAVTQFVPVVREELIVPDSTFAPDGTPGGAINPGMGNDPNRSVAQDKIQDAPDDTGWAQQHSTSLSEALMGRGNEADTTASTIAMGVAGGGNGGGAGPGAGDLSGAGAGGQLAPWGPPGGGNGIGPKTNFAGSGGNALTVVFVCDASGSMNTKFDQVKLELEKSIRNLQPIQQFNIIFFQTDKAVALSDTGMLQARPDNKNKAYTFLKTMSAHSGTDPLPALTMAFNEHPQLIYLLTDGDFPDNNAVIHSIVQLNGRHLTKINTILFLAKRNEEGDLQTFMDVMKQIASQNHGIFLPVAADEL
jgi:hypothetical protein